MYRGPVQPEAARSRLHGRVDRNPDATTTSINFHRVAPSRARGSKLLGIDVRDLAFASRLHGRVDRNTGTAWQDYDSSGRAFTGAWIETTWRVGTGRRAQSRLHGRVDRNRWQQGCWRRQGRRAFTGAWIETRIAWRGCLRGLSRLHGRVDRNLQIEDGTPGDIVAPSRARGSKQQGARDRAGQSRRAFTGAWIETFR